MLPHRKHLTVYHQVKLYDDVKVDSRVCDYLLEQAQTRAYKVVVNKISQNIISHWSKPVCEPWQDIDPYSSLEEVNSLQASDTNDDVLPEDPVTSMVSTYRYSLHEGPKSVSVSLRPQRKARNNISYLNPYVTLDLPPSPRKERKHIPHESGPSKQWIAAWKTVT